MTHLYEPQSDITFYSSLINYQASVLNEISKINYPKIYNLIDNYQASALNEISKIDYLKSQVITQFLSQIDDIYYSKIIEDYFAVLKTETSSIITETSSIINYEADIYLEIESLFIDSREIFKDDTESNFSRQLTAFIYKYGIMAVEAITGLILYRKDIAVEVVSEALRWLGNINHPESYKFRLWVLEKCLEDSFRNVRNGVILGLSSLNDPDAIKYLRDAISSEVSDEMRYNMQQLLAQLKLKKASSLQKNWDSYGADPPNSFALFWAEKTLAILSQKRFLPSHVAPSVENGIGISFSSDFFEDKYSDIEFFNEGNILAVIYNRQEDPEVWEVDVSIEGITSAIEKIYVFLQQ